MNTSLIYPRHISWSPNFWTPLGLTYIASILEKAGHKVKILDLNAFKMSDDDILKNVKNSDIIGIGGSITEYMNIINLTNLIKDNSDIPIILGGPCTTTLYNKVLENTKADYAVIGEGETSTANLIDAIENQSSLNKVKGIVYKNDGKVIMTEPRPLIENLDEIPFPARHLLDMKKYIYDYLKTHGVEIEGYKNLRSTTIISSRGCPYHCTFCDKGIWGYKFRARSAKNIVDEIILLKEKYNINCIWFTDDTFIIDRNRVEEFSKKMEDLDVVWCINGRVNLMQSKDIFIKLRKGNCRLINFGFESGDQGILDNSIKKEITLEQGRRCVKFSKETGIRVGGFFIFGMPDETKETIKKTFEFARELDCNLYAFCIATAYIGTELYDRAIKDNIIREDNYLGKLYKSDHTIDANVSLTKNLTVDELKGYHNEAFKEFIIKKQFGRLYYLNPSFIKGVTKTLLTIKDINEAKNKMKLILEKAIN
jgi:magnesium-protoporphyrin IX monomethyl ester (oxidative) cyclase